MKTFTLPKLSYRYDALQPWVDAQTMEIHYTKHHQGYVDKLNKALQSAGVQDYSSDLSHFLRRVGSYDNMAIRNNLGGHANHTLFWDILSPAGEGQPSGDFEKIIDEAFGSMEDFQEVFTKQALTQFGSGWAWLVVDDEGKLFVTQTPNQDNPLMDLVDKEKQGIPILGLDVWEHAYYLKYQNRRADYVDAFWQVVNWECVARRYQEALA
ncbi:MAG: superoxide dismutase [Bacteroidota bacterium]